MSPAIVPRYFFTDIRFRWNNGVLTVWPISEGSSQITNGGFWGTLLWLHRTSCKNLLCTASECPLTTERNTLKIVLALTLWVNLAFPSFVLDVNRKRSPSTHSSIRWCQTRPLSVWCGCRSCIGLPTWRTVRHICKGDGERLVEDVSLSFAS